MSTYDISFNGITILKNIKKDDVNKEMNTMRNYIFLTSSGMTLKDIEGGIEVTLNREENHCNN